MTRSVAFIAAALAVIAGRPALAQHTPQACVLNLSAADGRLPVRRPTLNVYAYNGRIWVAPQPTQSAPPRSRDPMAIRLSNVEAGTTLKLARQGKSQPLVELTGPNRKYTCGELQELAKKALVWKNHMELTPTVDNAGSVFVKVEKDPGKVWWPDTRVKLTGRTRDGQELPAVVGAVAGLPNANESHFNVATMSNQNVMLSGRFLPSARAWMQFENLLVSEPTQNKGQIHEGQALVKKAAAYQKASEKLTVWMQTMQQAVNSGQLNSDPAKLQKIRNAIQKVSEILNYGPPSRRPQARQSLQAWATQLHSQGTQLVAAGSVVRSVMLSVGAMPVQASISLANQRLAIDGNAPLRATSAASDEHGFAKAEVAGIGQDNIHASLSFPRVGNQKVGSTLNFEFQVPGADRAADVTVDGVKFYRVRPTATAIHNDQPDQQ